MAETEREASLVSVWVEGYAHQLALGRSQGVPASLSSDHTAASLASPVAAGAGDADGGRVFVPTLLLRRDRDELC